ncbi:YccS family putative transporter [Acidovorax sp. Be4]|uniref:YccS family putative transporter n=1 Tax=Acidovorax bellezanensis TaxID=2976702 RepID=A0ABT2PIY7_9BURK|nr:YccS family putative transporter [Acidovorax sp. Be4]MCT9809764.1 YccS family putative transporter [Acidovorax sp. Be4]
MATDVGIWLKRTLAQGSWAYGLRVCIALGGAMALCWWLDRLPQVMPLFLGIIASALAETDDSWRGRCRALAATLACFALVAFSVEALQPWPLGFAAALLLFTFAFTLLGAMGERYRAIASAAVILALYTAISMAPGAAAAHARPGAWPVPALLVAGAAWYGLLSVGWCALFPHAPVRQNLAQLYAQLGAYLRLKASLFEPVRAVDLERRRMALAQTNGQVVACLNQVKESLFSRLGPQPRQQVSGEMLRHMNLYFIAQDIHERASSSHYRYNEWAQLLFHSDVLYRCQRVLSLQGAACSQLAEALRQRVPFAPDAEGARAMEDLRAAIDYLEAQQQPAWQRPLRSLRALVRNLATLDAQLAAATHPTGGSQLADSSLFNRRPRSLTEAWARIRAQLHPSAPLLRHALRLSLALAAGFAAMQFTDPEHGYWIVMTTLFVCLPTYGATLARVSQRILGTVIGLVAGWALLRLFPGLALQSLIVVAAGVMFFVTRTQRYVTATAAITLLVLLSFHQTTGDAYALIWPRLIDTLLGAAIATAAMLLVLPDWQGRRLHLLVAQAIAAHAAYLREIMSQYATGKDDDLDYRLARRNAHNADAALSTALAQLLLEPRAVRRHARVGMQLLLLSHTLLNYLSALGAHREQLFQSESHPLAVEAARHAADRLEQMAQALKTRQPLPAEDGRSAELAQALEQCGDAPTDPLMPVLTPLVLVCQQLAPLRAACAQLQSG